MIKPELSLFKMQFKGMFGNAIKLSQSTFSETPKRLNAVDVSITSGKLIVAVVDSVVLIKANIYQTIIASPTIRVNHTGNVYFASDNGLQNRFRGVGNNLGVDIIATLQKTKDDCLAASASASFTSDPLRAKVRLVSFQLTRKRRALGTPSTHTYTNTKIDGIDASYRNTAQCSTFSSRQIQCKMTNNDSEFSFAEFRTSVVPIFINHFMKLACFEYMFAS